MLLNAGNRGEYSEKKSLVKGIEVVKSILADNAITANGLTGEIDYLEYQIIAAQKIVRLIDNQETISGQELMQLGEQLTLLKNEKKIAFQQYQSILLEEYKNRDYKNKLYFLASSKSLVEFVNRLNHLSRLKEFRTKQLRAIANKEKEVRDKLEVYNGNASQKLGISNQKIEQITKLSELLREYHQKYSEIADVNQQLNLKLKNKQEALAALSAEIKENISQDLHSHSDNNVSIKLQWPIKKGLIVGRFGVHKHPKERKVKVENNGIDVLVSNDEKIYATQDGTIKAILEIPGSNQCIILDHGTFYSVFTNLQGIKLVAGDQVKSGDYIADIAINDEGLRKLHFEVWRGTSKVNPEKYMENPLH
jgi:murein DD-endopeptidase MepM/ murein hydrolase activator NlpD